MDATLLNILIALAILWLALGLFAAVYIFIKREQANQQAAQRYEAMRARNQEALERVEAELRRPPRG